MNKSFRVLFLTLLLSWSALCHELLNDFLKFNYESSHLTKTCVDDLKSIRNGIKNNDIWALKGKKN